MLNRVVREVFRREALPARVRWWLAAAGMRDWFAYLRKNLAPHCGARTEALLAASAATMFRRRGEVLSLHGDAEIATFMAGLYRVLPSSPAGWLFEGLGGAPRTAAGVVASMKLLRRADPEARWREVTVHLGELLIVLTDELPKALPHARKILGDICFRAGVRYARRMKRAWKIEEPIGNAPALAIEVLRTSEYLFRVNPEHWGDANAQARTGFIEGTACPWFERPGWNGAHCGIFGQFQAGVSSEFGLKYILGKTIPKHGGTTCRIDLKPIEPSSLVRGPSEVVGAAEATPRPARAR